MLLVPYGSMAWEVALHRAFAPEFAAMAELVQDELIALMKLLELPDHT